MFSNIIFLVIVLVLISFVPMGNGNDWFASPTVAFILGMGVYALLLGIIYFQNKFLKKAIRQNKNALLFVVNIDLIAFLTFYHFIIAGHRLFPDSTALVALFSILLYFLGLYTYHVSAYEYVPAGSRGAVRSAWDYSFTQLRLLIPFAIPFLLFSLIFDIVTLYPNAAFQNLLFFQEDSLIGTAILFGITVLFLVLIMFFFPPLIQAIWKCKPIRDSELLDRLESLCRKANFKHAGIKTWTVMDHAYTAGIIGILPRFRYVMFTKRLLNEFSPETIEAILAHEIGHSYRKHLLIYPFIILGMVVCTGLFSLFFMETIDEFFILQDFLHPSPVWKVLYPFFIFIPYVIILALYFRLVFGYFSRLFERQADLHVFELGVPPEHMQQALDDLGTITGNTHFHPSWHHHSIHKRMKFLDHAAADPEVVIKHHRRVKRDLVIYLILLLAACMLLMSSLIPDVSPFQQLNSFAEESSRKISDWFNANLREQLPKKNYNKPTERQSKNDNRL